MCDLGALRALPKHTNFSADACLVISDLTFAEAADSADGAAPVNKLRSILEHPEVAPRFLIAHHWQTIVAQEHRTKQAARTRDIINHEMTLHVRRAVARRDDWRVHVHQALRSQAYRDYVDLKTAFVTGGNAFALDDRNAPVRRAFLSGELSLVSWIRRPQLVTEFLYARPTRLNWRSRKWRAQLEVFPDRLAVGRWIRLMAYYSMRRLMAAEQPDAKYSNNYEDASYAFLASYTRHLATQDGLLRECVGALFPNVTIVQPDAPRPS